MDELYIISPLLIGWGLDLLIGDPTWLPHPVVGFGKTISFFEHRLNHPPHQRISGGFTAIGLILSTFLLSWLILRSIERWEWVEITVCAIGIFYCLAGTTLAREVRLVFEAADKSIADGRRQVSRIVGRDTAALSLQEIRTAALETLAENLSDGVIAPLFWYALLGLPGMLAYKMVNTLDSMIGYKTSRYAAFGFFAAKIDDIANFIPARLTAFLMVIAAGKPSLIGYVWKYGRMHASPNSGYPEAALAGILNCRFGGTHDYFGETVIKPYIGDNPRLISTSDMRKAIRINRISETIMIALVILWLIATHSVIISP